MPPGDAPATPILAAKRRTLLPLAAIAALIVLSVILLRIEGRRWWCQCATPRVWIGDVWTSHCSQHLSDPYSLTHVSHGLIFFWALAWLAPRWPILWRLTVAVAIAAGWEVLENSPMIIERYRTATMSLDYLGDSAVNAVGDIASCALGFFIAMRLGLWLTVALFAAAEAILLLTIRDNLSLGVLMLIYPIDAIRDWQTAAAPR